MTTTTHSSYVLNKLSVDKICLLHDSYKRLHQLDKEVVKTLKRLPGYDTLRVALSHKVVLVEGPSDELILKKIYQNKNEGRLPELDGIDIIVVRGVGFKTFIEIGKVIGTEVKVLRDNDGNYERNVVEARRLYDTFPNIKLISSSDNSQYSLEPALIAANASSEEELLAFAKIMLSSVTYNLLAEEPTFEDQHAFFVDWFKSTDGDGKGRKKVDAAIRLFESTDTFKFPAFLDEVLNFD